MSADFDIPTETILVGKPDPKTGKQGSFSVRGVNADDVVFITTVYFEDLKTIVAKYGKNGHIQPGKVGELVMAVIKDFPLMTAEIISRCADANGEVDKFRGLSFFKQIEALKAIMVLSSDDGGTELLKKAGAFLVSLLEANGLHLGTLTTQLQTIIGTSVSQSPTSK